MSLNRPTARGQLAGVLALLSLASAGWDGRAQPEKPDPYVAKVRGGPEWRLTTLPPELEAKLPRVDLIRPLPLTTIPDDPPPHEGAMFDIPYVVEPPDILIVEVLEALPGRPITGERLVRPDGTLSLGFYGDVHVRGLTPDQIKTKLILHLRKRVSDTTLGLMAPVGPEPEPPPDAKPELPDAKGPGKSSSRDRSTSPDRPSALKAVRTVVPARRGTPDPGRRRLRFAADDPKDALMRGISPFPEKPNPPGGSPLTEAIAVPPSGSVKVTIEISPAPVSPPRAAESPRLPTLPLRLPEPPEPPGVPPPTGSPPPMPDPDEPSVDSEWTVRMIPVEENSRVIVDIAKYNSKVYFVEGDVNKPGRLPITGQETVLDVINFAGGLTPTADPKNIRLVRPARGGKPAKVYPIDLQAILDKGDARANLQIFPGDRLVVGRNPVVTATVELDRIGATMTNIWNQMLTSIFVRKNLMSLGEDGTMTPAQREAIVKEWVETWLSRAKQAGGEGLDEKAFRQHMLPKLTPEPQPNKGGDAKPK
jgi:protein involved in polysaccharide export with SLBB domain